MEIVAQRIKITYEKSIDKAIAYYSLLSVLNNLKWQQREIQLLAFTSVRGTITPLPAREEFAKQFKSSLNTIENMKSKLYKKGYFVKDGDMYRVHPSIALQFDKPVVLKIDLL